MGFGPERQLTNDQRRRLRYRGSCLSLVSELLIGQNADLTSGLDCTNIPLFRRFGDRSHTETTVRRPDGTEERTESGAEDFERAWADRGAATAREAEELSS